MGEAMSSGELRSDLMLRLREGRCGEVGEGKEHPPLDMLGIAGQKKRVSGYVCLWCVDLLLVQLLLLKLIDFYNAFYICGHISKCSVQ